MWCICGDGQFKYAKHVDGLVVLSLAAWRDADQAAADQYVEPVTVEPYSSTVTYTTAEGAEVTVTSFSPLAQPVDLGVDPEVTDFQRRFMEMTGLAHRGVLSATMTDSRQYGGGPDGNGEDQPR
jgi:hypothetical protein